MKLLYKTLSLLLIFLFFSVCSIAQEYKTLKGHTGNILTLAYSPDGSYLVSGSSDNNIMVWNGESGELIRKIEPGRNDVQKILFIGNTSQIAVGSNSDSKLLNISVLGEKINHQTLHVWDVLSGKEVSGFEYFNSVDNFDIPKDNNKNITFGLLEWEASYPAGGKIASISESYSVVNYNIKNKNIEKFKIDDNYYEYEHGLKVEKYRVEKGLYDQPFSYSADGKFFVFANHKVKRDYEIIVCETSTNKILKRIPSVICNRISYSLDGKYIASISDFSDDIEIISVELGKRIKTLKGHDKSIYDIAFHPNSLFIASASKDETVKIWDLNTGKCVKTLKGFENDVRSIAFSPNGKLLATGCDNETIRLWDLTLISPELKKFAMEYDLSKGVESSMKKDMDKEIKTLDEKFKPKGEFENTEEYNLRISNANAEKQAIEQKYAKLIEEAKNQKASDLTSFKDQVAEENQKKIDASVRDTVLKISSVGNYNADNETFPITINYVTENINIPRTDAVDFKKNFAKATVRAKKRLSANLSAWEFFDIYIINPNNNVEYKFK